MRGTEFIFYADITRTRWQHISWKASYIYLDSVCYVYGNVLSLPVLFIKHIPTDPTNPIPNHAYEIEMCSSAENNPNFSWLHGTLISWKKPLGTTNERLGKWRYTRYLFLFAVWTYLCRQSTLCDARMEPLVQSPCMDSGQGRYHITGTYIYRIKYNVEDYDLYDLRWMKRRAFAGLNINGTWAQ